MSEQARDEDGKFASGSGGGSSHKVPLPKNPKKITIAHAQRALSEMGGELGSASFDGNSVSYQVKLPGGKSQTMSVDDLKKYVYSRRAS